MTTKYILKKLNPDLDEREIEAIENKINGISKLMVDVVISQKMEEERLKNISKLESRSFKRDYFKKNGAV